MEAKIPRKGMKQLDLKGCVWAKPKDEERLGRRFQEGEKVKCRTTEKGEHLGCVRQIR